jgi:hypothetical protein
MKPGKISVPSLVGAFLVLGLVADLLPYPGLGPGVVARTVDWVVSTIQVAPAAAVEVTTP